MQTGLIWELCDKELAFSDKSTPNPSFLPPIWAFYSESWSSQPYFIVQMKACQQLPHMNLALEHQVCLVVVGDTMIITRYIKAYFLNCQFEIQIKGSTLSECSFEQSGIPNAPKLLLVASHYWHSVASLQYTPPSSQGHFFLCVSPLLL